jgi:hypothetical protein
MLILFFINLVELKSSRLLKKYEINTYFGTRKVHSNLVVIILSQISYLCIHANLKPKHLSTYV